MPFTIKIKPIQKWIGPETKDPGYSRFRKTYSDTKKILEYELYKLDAIDSSVQLEMFIHPDDLRRDGELRANCRPYKQGVVLSFTRVKGRFLDKAANTWKNKLQTLSYPCDTYNDWQENLRAIALSLENLRAVARYGVFKYEEMVSRLSLPEANGKSDPQTAAEFISKYCDYPPHSLADIKFREKAYRQAAMKTHPDGGGSHELFIEFQEAKKVLENHFN
jgi:hypothetical protein